MKSSASTSKPFQSRCKGEIPGRGTQKERLSRSELKQAFLTDSDAELFVYLIQCIRFGSWKVRCLNRALVSLASLRLRFSLQSDIQCFVNDRLISRVERKWKYSEFFYHNSVDQAYMTQPKPCFFSSLLGRKRFWDSDDEWLRFRLRLRFQLRPLWFRSRRLCCCWNNPLKTEVLASITESRGEKV